MDDPARMPAAPGRGERRRMALFSVLGGLALIGAAAPWLAASLLKLPSDGVRPVLLRGEDPRAARLAAFINDRRAALGWVGDGTTWFDIGLAELARARKADDATAEGRRRLDAAAAAFDRGLARKPGDSVAWLRLGEALLRRDGPSPQAARALHMSIRTGLFLPRVMIERLRLAAKAWPHLDAAARDAVEHQVRMALGDRWLGPRLHALVAEPEVSYVLAPLTARIAAEPSGEISLPLSR